jgi:hypothetical protein
MRKALSVIALVLLAVPAFAQDDGGFGGLGGDSVLTGGDIDALLGGGNRGNRGNNNNNNDQIPNPENLLLQVKDLLKLKKVPLTKDQEKTLKPFLDTETTTMRTDLEAQFGNRGGNRGNNNTATMLTELFAGVTKSNNELLTTMKADLTPDQVALITKAEKDKKVCTVMLDLINPQQLQQNRGNDGGRGNRGNNNNQGFNPPPGFEDLIGFPQGGGNNNRGNQNNNFFQNMPDRAFCTTGASTTAERLAPISTVLTKGKKPLTPDQEKKFAGLIETALPKMQEELRAANPNMQQLLNDLNRNRNNQNNQNNQNQNPAVNPQTLRNNIVNTIMTQLGIPNNNNNNNNNNRGGRGNQPQNNQAQPNQPQNNQAQNNPNANNQNANNPNNNNQNFNRGGRGNNNNFNPQAEIRKKNEELYDKIAAKLTPEQGAVIRKYKYDQIKARKGAEEWRAIMEEEKTPLTPEQLTQIQQIFNAQNQLARQYADQLVEKEMAAAPTLEPPPLPANQQQQNRNPNNVAQNPVAQQIIQKVMPEVSKRHAILVKSVEDTILKTLTPPQVASYKLSKL